MSRFPIPAADAAAPFQTEIIIRRSRFLTHCAHTPGMEAARAFVEQIRTKHADATHNCWAYVAGEPGSTAQIGASDDGEPKGTAGRPMLTVLLHCGVGEIAAVVTRYFGGILLGTGGLVRAYQGLVKLGLETLPVTERVPCERLRITLEHRFVNIALREFENNAAVIVEKDFALDATFTLNVPQSNFQTLIDVLTQKTSGALLIEKLKG